MKTKIAGLASTALLLLAPISGAFSAVAESQVVQAENNWDYDTADPGLGEYDRLLQNAGPSDGQIDWYPAEHFASSKNIRPSLLVKQLIDLSIATNSANSNARKVLFNDTTGVSKNSDYQDTYKKYKLALGFIAQLLAFNNERTGQGAYLKQGFESEEGNRFSDEDIIAETNQKPDPAILGTPQPGEGVNISDVLGRAFFGNADDAYAQLYVNGYDNTVQNAPNIIRETTTSITIVAQSKLTGRKATAIFKLNNRTFNNLPDEVLLENNIDNSPSFAGAWGNKNIPDGEEKNLGDSTDGTFNQRGNLVTGLTGDQKRLLSNGGSSAWVDPKTGSGTIVVPRGTSAAEIAKKIKQLGYKSNYNISNVAPMKAIHGDKFTSNPSNPPYSAVTDKNSYNVTFAGGLSLAAGPSALPVADGGTQANTQGNVTGFSNNFFSSSSSTPTPKAENTNFAVADPRLDPINGGSGYDDAPDIYEHKDLKKNFSNSLLYNPLNTNKNDVFGFNDPAKGYSNSTAGTIPNQEDFARQDNLNPFDISSTSYNLSQNTGFDSQYADNQLGNVVHAFDPKIGSKATDSPFKVREAWDDTHAIFGTAPFTGLTEEEIKNQIAQNGSFNNTSGDQIKKSFTFNMPLNNSVMKSYRNPYSTVISTALPFAKGNPFAPSTNYLATSANMNSSGFTGDYLSTSSGPITNPWYENGNNGHFSEPFDNSSRAIGVASASGGKTNSLHLNSNTWIKDRHDSGDGSAAPGVYNVSNDYNDNNEFTNWVSENSNPDVYLKGNEQLGVHSKHNDGYPSWQLGPDNTHYLVDAHNEDKFTGFPNDPTDPPSFDTDNDLGATYRQPENWPGRGSSGVNNKVEVDGGAHNYSHTEQHFQLAKNVGYILINAQNIDENLGKQLSDYQIPQELSGTGDLDGIANKSAFTASENRPFVKPVDDDPNYHGGLLGKMSIIGLSGSGTLVDPITQSKAGSIFNNSLNQTDHNYLKSPTTDGAGNYTVRVEMAGNDPVGAKYNGTNLHYGLAWNDSSDLPQVKIRRTLNAQYLVPVSVARTVSTTWHQENSALAIYNRRTNSAVSRHHYTYTFGGWDNNQTGYKRTVTTDYKDYKLYLGDVTLKEVPDGTASTDNKVNINTNSIATRNANHYNSIQTPEDGIGKLRPVNNQINYDRLLEGHPHYDSELFDHGSNRDDVTVTRGGNLTRGFVGTSEEKEDDSTDEAKVGSSDDYSIGIVKAPSQFFEGADGSGVFKAKDGVARSTENAAENRPGINLTADSPENNNGMSIGKTSSYATLAQAYNVEINGNKAVGKADDNSKNKGDRVALVQQLLDNGGNAEAYYYIPSLPRLYEKWNEARINVVVYDKAAVPAPSKAETKPSFSTTDVSTGNDPFNVNLRPYTTVYDDGAVLKASDVPQNFKNLLTRELVAGNPDLVTSDGKVATDKLQQILVGAFLNSWQQNDGSFNQTDTGAGVNSPLYLYGGFGISNSDSKNSYSQWPDGYTTPNLNSSKYHEAVTNYPGDFYRGGKDLKTTGATVIKGIPATALKADVSKVDLSKAGTYPVVYTYTNPSNDKDSASITVPVTVTDGAAPVFAFQGGSDLTIKVGESFDRSAFKVVGSWQIFNKYQGDYDKLVNYEGIAKNSKGEPDVTISGDVDTQTPGIYQLTYKATSTGGAVTTMNRNITVLPKETTGSDWKVSDFTSVGYINYVPNYGINVWNAPAGTFTGQRLTHGTSWKIFQRAVNSQGKVYYNVGKNQWIDGAYVSFTPVSAFQPLNGIVTINYVRGYGVNLWKAPKTTGGYYEGRKLQDGTKWKVFGIQDGFYKVGGNQWIQAKYAKFQAR